MITKEQVNKIFSSELGQQLDIIYITSDGRAFIRYNEAKAHTEGKLDKGTQPLEDKTIKTFINEN